MIKLDDISQTALISDFIKERYVPRFDELLDWRNRLILIKSRNPDKNSVWYDDEIRAVDFLLANSCSVESV